MIQICYLLAAVLFIFGLKFMAHPRTAVRGNRLGAAGMALALIVTLFDPQLAGYGMIATGLVLGALVGIVVAQRVEMTQMPQLVAIFNGLGGGASVLVAGAELFKGSEQETSALIAATTSGIIGAVTFWGSLVACGKLQELKMFWKPISLPNHQLINAALVALMLLLAWGCVANDGSFALYFLMAVVGSIVGILLTVPIGGADMPVVIALLNSYSGLAASATGFVINNNVLIISGALVGASGLILTQIMCKAMNRSLFNVLFGVMDGGSSSDVDVDEVYANVRRTSADDVAMILDTAQRVVIVPGYGMAVAQAQHAVRDLANQLTARGATVEYAIHPVAGRMPGHMNVLLAEADVPYEQLMEMDQINPTMGTVDVSIVLGANDVVNPVAKTDPSSPIAGMPIIDVDQSRTVIVIKRSLSPGFAGIPNPLFAADNALMLFGDGKQAVMDIVAALKEL
ncbi:MAG: NAD(P)(+) transhydrogenase (Re/Si-specific) subunit beta [Planctomycetota bacterium]